MNENCSQFEDSSKPKNPEILKFDTFLKAIENSVGTKIFQNAFILIDGDKIDLMKNGDVSCAYFVSGILTLFGYLEKPLGTVKSTRAVLKNKGWKTVDELVPGCIIVWEERKGDTGEDHKHIGFYYKDNLAISNSSQMGHPVIHDIYYSDQNGHPTRKIIEILFNPFY